MKKLILIFFYLAVIAVIIYYQKPIGNFFVEKFMLSETITEYTTNEYSKKANYNYVSITNDFSVKTKSDIMAILYTILDSGLSEFTFYCDRNYKDCASDISDIANPSNTLNILNNFVHPFNSYNKLNIITNSYGKVLVNIDKLYDDTEINYINLVIETISKEILTNKMTNEEKIKAFHDYIVNNTKYDVERSEELKNNIYNENNYESHKATGVLQNHLGLCSGYTDIMAIFLNNLGIINYKISTTTHVWNAVFLEKQGWVHLDMTWDDPVTTNNENSLTYDFFLIDDIKLEGLDMTLHSYDKSVYSEISH